VLDALTQGTVRFKQRAAEKAFGPVYKKDTK
jgi:hypothetical protein